jgi:hypothetical protein
VEIVSRDKSFSENVPLDNAFEKIVEVVNKAKAEC